MTPKAKKTLLLAPLWFFVVLATAISMSLAVYRPDRPVGTIEPGSSDGPTFVVQLIRPRLGLPMGGLLPPKWFGEEASLGFDSRSNGASVGIVSPRRIELHAEGWDLRVVIDEQGHVSADTEVVFEFRFEGWPRTVRGLPGVPPVGTVSIPRFSGENGYSGSFDIEIARCEDAETGEALGWPPNPLVLHGSFDRLQVGTVPGVPSGTRAGADEK